MRCLYVMAISMDSNAPFRTINKMFSSDLIPYITMAMEKITNTLYMAQIIKKRFSNLFHLLLTTDRCSGDCGIYDVMRLCCVETNKLSYCQ